MFRSNNSWILFLTALLFLFGQALFVQVKGSAAQSTQYQTKIRIPMAARTLAGSVILKASKTPAPVQIASNHATRTPRPTSTPPVIPPPADPASTNLMIFLAGIIVLVILVGIWINRGRVL